MPALTRARLALLALVTCALPIGLPAVTTSSAASTAPTLSFGPGQPADPQRDQGEPNIEIDAQGRIYTCGPTGFTTGADYAQVSTDGGDQFHLLGTPPRGQLADRGGGDCYLATGKKKNAQGTYTLSYIGLADTDFTTATSLDYGASFAATPSTCSGVTDRQWTTFIDDKTAFLIYNDLEPRATVVQKSTDGGLTWTGYGACGPAAKKTAATNPDFPGPIKADVNGAHNSEKPGQPLIYFGYNRGNNVYLGLSVDSGDTWRQCLIAKTDNDPSNGFVTVDHDNAGNVYASWGEKGTHADAFDARYAWLPVSKLAGCKTETVNPGWSAPVRVDASPVQTLVFPWLVASGEPGRVAIAWYGSTSDGVADSATFKGPWDVYVAQTLNAQAAKPTFTQVKATTHPLHYDQVCLSGLACTTGGDRSLADFFAIAVDPTTKRLVLVYDESGKVPDGPNGPVAIPNVLVQNTGPSNLGGSVSLRRAVIRTSQVDPAGDAQAPYSLSTLAAPAAPPAASRTNQPGLDILSVAVAPEFDLKTFKPVAGGGLTVTMKVKDLGTSALQSALTASDATSLVWAFRWINGYRPASLSVHWDPARGFAGGFDDYATGSVTCLSVPATTGLDPKCMTYPGATAVPTDVNTDGGGVIRMSVPRKLLKALGGLDTKGRPAQVAAATGSRFYSGTAFSMGNVSAPEAQGYLYPVDGTAAFDFVLGAARPGSTRPVAGPGTTGSTGSGSGSGGRLPATGGLGWPIVGAVALAVALWLRRLRRRQV
ncbi:MAG: hypothetical protein JWP11_1623 [Frankiales bacterium]|nr:hypothetical protein [Frankiales bacterium]